MYLPANNLNDASQNQGASFAMSGDYKTPFPASNFRRSPFARNNYNNPRQNYNPSRQMGMIAQARNAIQAQRGPALQVPFGQVAAPGEVSFLDEPAVEQSFASDIVAQNELSNRRPAGSPMPEFLALDYPMAEQEPIQIESSIPGERQTRRPAGSPMPYQQIPIQAELGIASEQMTPIPTVTNPNPSGLENNIAVPLSDGLLESFSQAAPSSAEAGSAETEIVATEPAANVPAPILPPAPLPNNINNYAAPAANIPAPMPGQTTFMAFSNFPANNAARNPMQGFNNTNLQILGPQQMMNMPNMNFQGFNRGISREDLLGEIRLSDFPQIEARSVAQGDEILAPNPDNVALSQTEFDTIRYTNAMRQQKGKKILTVKGDLTASARESSNLMRDINRMEHHLTDGWAGENLAQGFTDAEATSFGWRNSPGHYENLMRDDINYIGAGDTIGQSGTIFWTQHFG